MRRFLVAIASTALLVSACGGTTETGGGETAAPTSAAPTTETAAECATRTAGSFLTPGTLTIGTDNPAYPPYFQGGETEEHPDWSFNDPYTGEGFEAAVAYEVAMRMGFASTAVEWTLAPFGQTYKPGPKTWDFAIEQISYSDKRAQAVDFSESYYDVNQALIAVADTPIAGATSIADLSSYRLAAPIGTTSYDFIVETIRPTEEPGGYSTLSDTVAALNAGQVDGIIVDLPTALYLADPYVQEAQNSVVVGQFATAAGGEYFGMTFELGSPLVACVDLALDAMREDGTLQALQTTWLSEQTNVGEVPVLE